MNALVVAAHPDDEILGCGGTINNLKRNGYGVSTLIITQGRDTKIDQKLDTLPLVEIISTVEQAVITCKPDIVFTHYIKDLNRDHQIVAEATMVACRPQSGVKELLSYMSISSSNNVLEAFPANVFMKLTREDINFKKKSMQELYSSELMKYPHPRSLESIEVHARYWGSQINCEYAEVFSLIRKDLI